MDGSGADHEIRQGSPGTTKEIILDLRFRILDWGKGNTQRLGIRCPRFSCGNLKSKIQNLKSRLGTLIFLLVLAESASAAESLNWQKEWDWLKRPRRKDSSRSTVVKKLRIRILSRDSTKISLLSR